MKNIAKELLQPQKESKYGIIIQQNAMNQHIMKNSHSKNNIKSKVKSGIKAKIPPIQINTINGQV